jgi:hypothetical protein
MKKLILAASLSSLMLAGCAGMQKPTTEKLTAMPVVEFGQPIPAGNEFILHFAAGQPIPTNVSIKGSLFEQAAEQTLNVKLRRDIYTYKQWVSYDNVTWRDGQEVIQSNIELKIPSHQHPKAGIITVQMDEKR